MSLTNKFRAKDLIYLVKLTTNMRAVCTIFKICLKNFVQVLHEVTKNWRDSQGYSLFILHGLPVKICFNYENEMLKQNFANITLICNYLCQI